MLNLFLGAVCISLAPIFVKLIDLGPTASGFYRCFLATLIFIAWGYKKEGKTYFEPILKRGRWLVLAAVAGFFFFVDLFAWHRSIITIGAGFSTILANTQVFYVAIIGVTFLGEKVTPKLFLSIPLAFFGIYLLVGYGVRLSELIGADQYQYGVLYGMATGLVYAIFLYFLRETKKAQPKVRPDQILMVISLLAAVFLGITSYLEGTLEWPSFADLGWAILLAGLAQVLGWSLISSGLPRAPISIGGLILLCQPMLSTLWGGLIFGEALENIQWVGVALTLGAIYLGSTASKQAR